MIEFVGQGRASLIISPFAFVPSVCPLNVVLFSDLDFRYATGRKRQN